MTTAAFEEIAENLEFLDEWEDRYRYVIELGKDMPGLSDAQKSPATKVDGCASQVWIVPKIEGSEGILRFEGDSDALIVRGLIAILLSLMSGRTAEEILSEKPEDAFERIGLTSHLSSQRSNGLKAMIERIRIIATSAKEQAG